MNIPRLQEFYSTKVVSEFLNEKKYTNRMQIPVLKKIIVSMCIKEAISDNKALERAMKDLASITGQHPRLTRAKKSIANFKLRQGMPLGCFVTLRGKRMYEFLDRFINIALPRVRDFRGLSKKGFDGSGNYSLGVKEHIIFPEIDYDKVDKVLGMNISFVTTAITNEEGALLLEKLGIPFK